MSKRTWIFRSWMVFLFAMMVGFIGQLHLSVGAAENLEQPAAMTTQEASQTTTQSSAQTTTQIVTATEENASTASKETVNKPVVTIVGSTYNSVTLNWKKVKNAKRYLIYRKDSKKGSYKLIGSTTKLKYKNKKLKKTHTYYYRVVAAKSSPSGEVMSKQSKTKKAKTKPVIKKTAYVGDSVMTGMGPYAGVKGKGRKVIAKIGVSTWNFWRGTIMDDLLNYKADRIYIMLGMNSLGGDGNDAQLNTIISNYKKIIDDCKAQNKNVEIIVLAVSPAAANATVKNSAINAYNKKLKEMAKKKKVYYYDYTADFRDSNGCLKSNFNGGDGIHWTAATYQMFKKKLDAYGKKLDKN